MAARELPARPSLEQYRKQSKDLLKGFKSGDPEALHRIKAHHPRLANVSDAELYKATFALADAQLVIAREHGFESWPKFVKHIEWLIGRSPATVWRLAEKAIVAGDATTLERLLRDHEDIIRHQRPQSSWFGGLTPDYDAGDARAIIVSSHHFDSWAQFAEHLETLKDRDSPVTRFEATVDAIVSGDIATIERQLDRDPELIRARSARTHHSMLLHYVGANGVEGFRQRTPKNGVQVAEALIRAGAEVDAVADMYGGSTTLGLVATSIHPKLAGLQNALIDVLLARGARMDHSATAGRAHPLLVNSCLANGRGEAAEYLVSRGAPLDLEAAAGVGRLDVVASFFNADGSLKPTATTVQMQEGFKRACAYGRTPLVDFLLDHGVDVDAKLTDGVWVQTTGLHLAAFGGHVDTVKTLLKRRVPIDVKDETYGTTPLTWALHAWSTERSASPDRYYHVVALLVAAGAKVEPDWLTADWLRADPKMREALTQGSFSNAQT